MQPGKIRDQEASWQEAALFEFYPALFEGTSIYCHERFKCEANGAQKPLSIRSTKQLNSQNK